MSAAQSGLLLEFAASAAASGDTLALLSDAVMEWSEGSVRAVQGAAKQASKAAVGWGVSREVLCAHAAMWEGVISDSEYSKGDVEGAMVAVAPLALGCEAGWGWSGLWWSVEGVVGVEVEFGRVLDVASIVQSVVVDGPGLKGWVGECVMSAFQNRVCVRVPPDVAVLRVGDVDVVLDVGTVVSVEEVEGGLDVVYSVVGDGAERAGGNILVRVSAYGVQLPSSPWTVPVRP